MLKGEHLVGLTIGETALIKGKTHLNMQFKNADLSYPSCRTYFSCMDLQEARYSSSAYDICRAELKLNV